MSSVTRESGGGKGWHNCREESLSTVAYQKRLWDAETLERCGVFARVVGYRLKFAVVTMPNGERCEYAWSTIANMAAKAVPQ